MKINLYDAHDRYQHFTGQSFDISRTCQNMVDQQPFGLIPFYIFAHKREIGMDERIAIYNEDWKNSLTTGNQRQFLSLDQVPTARIIWQPRLTKPQAQSNSMLFKAYPPSDKIKIIWIIPAPELWDQYSKGKMTQNEIICDSIYMYKTDRSKLEVKEDDDLDDATINSIYEDISLSAKHVPFLKI